MVTTSAQETKNVGKKIADSLTLSAGRGERGAQVLCIYGNLGAGKTTLVQGIAEGLGITSRLLSPTFIIVRRYQIPKQNRFLYHIDLYRVKDVREMNALALHEMMSESGSVVIIEWAERLGDNVPLERTDIRLSQGKGENGRNIEVSYGK